ncbi:relaxase/mobilization nuclease domain-containing protein [Aliarcobacter butzleri]|uniref:relaxase/mobilization nuclease domain-containing protein n=1 Tax=Aliarcobacter butzleri TaxID=28197 RepID=UPI002B241FF4|nr:hypothetical protein [Aliarcobacter butzleri]
MIINVKAKSTTDGGNYLIDREDEAFIIFEGDAKRFDSLAENLSSKRDITHYSYVLSFKEEHLTKDDLLKYYYDFKEKMFKNYLPEELEIFAVAHFDDIKPHIHCIVLSSSQIDNRDLRLYRGYVDFSRIEAVQELMNYENDLESPFDNINLLSLTPGQKKRDWKVKKREIKPYKILDDEVYEYIENLLKDPLLFSYQEFISSIENKFGEIKILKPKELAIDGHFNNSKLFKESQLVLLNHFTTEDKNLVYNSKLFDEIWFKKNIEQIKVHIQNRNLKNLKFKLDKKSYSKQLKVLTETTNKHEEHIYSRKIGRRYLNENKKILLFNKIANLNDIILKDDNKKTFQEVVEKFLFDLTKEDLIDFIHNFKISSYIIKKDENKNEYIEYTKNKIAFNIYNKSLLNYYKNGSIDGVNVNKLLQRIKQITNLKGLKNKEEFKILFEEIFYKKEIKKKKDFINLINSINLTIDRIGYDSKKGNYITLIDINKNKVRLYNDIFYNFLREDNESIIYKETRDKKISTQLNSKFINNYIKSIYLDIHKKDSKINSVKDYQLFKSEELIDTHFNTNKDNLNIDNLSFFSNIKKEEKISYTNGVLKVHKTLNKETTGKNIADIYFLQGIKDIKINSNIDKDILEAFKNRIKEKKYNITIWNEDDKLIFINPYYNKEELKPKELSNEDIKYIAKETAASISEIGDDKLKDLMIYIQEFGNINIDTKSGIEKFKALIKHLKEYNKNALEAVCLTSNIDIKRVGYDSTKGDYATFEFKGKKISVYDKEIVDLIEKTNSKEVLLSI